MKVFRLIDRLPAFNKAVITIGTFDGVHLGHQKIIQQLKEEAHSIGGESVLITFHPHPRHIIHPDLNLPELTTLEERIQLLRRYGIDNLVVVPFTEGFASLSAEKFIEEFLVDKFHPNKIIIGYDHKFGNNREGDFHLLEKWSNQYHYEVKEIDEQLIQESIISSTKIRTALLNAEIEKANQFLGHPYSFTGKIVLNNQTGRSIGFPTANLEISEKNKLIPSNGVYTVTAELEGGSNSLKGMMNIGMRPTVNGQSRAIEVHLFDFDQDIYDRHLTVWMHHYLRAEQKFSGLPALQEQLHKDKTQSIELLANFKF
jgi:riboflavin kinase/FMN adenylyltransferase